MALWRFPIMARMSFPLHGSHKFPVIWLERASRLHVCMSIHVYELTDYSFIHLVCTTRVSIDILNDSMGKILTWENIWIWNESLSVYTQNKWKFDIWWVHICFLIFMWNKQLTCLMKYVFRLLAKLLWMYFVCLH